MENAFIGLAMFTIVVLALIAGDVVLRALGVREWDDER